MTDKKLPGEKGDVSQQPHIQRVRMFALDLASRALPAMGITGKTLQEYANDIEQHIVKGFTAVAAKPRPQVVVDPPANGVPSRGGSVDVPLKRNAEVSGD